MFTIPFIDTFFSKLRPKVYDDFVDRINYYYTAMLLMFFAIMVAAKQYVGSPIQCWAPAQFKGGWEQYLEDYCFIKNTYYLPMDNQFPDYPQRKELEIGYYQWVPIMLALQALCFYVPCIIWKGLCWQSGIDVKAILERATEIKRQDPKDRAEAIDNLRDYVHDAMRMQRRNGARHGWLFIRWGQNLGSYLNTLYLITKVFYVCNVVAQFFLLNAFLGTSYRFYGIQVLLDVANGRDWQISGHFPRVTMCDFRVRDVGNIRPVTVQCVLMINLFNEKIYVIVWFWLVVVAIATCLNFIYWLFTSISVPSRHSVIKRYLRVYDDECSERVSKKQISTFVDNRLRPDGCLILRFISGHCGDIVAQELVEALYRKCNADDKCGMHVPELRVKMIDEKNQTVVEDKSDTPSSDDGFNETLYDPSKKNSPNAPWNRPLLPSAPTSGYPGPPAVMPKPKHV